MHDLYQILEDNNFHDFEIVASVNDINDIPELWRELISVNDLGDKKAILNTYWSAFADKLPKTLSLINNHLEDAVIIKQNGEYRLVYLINIDDFISVYVGHPPTVKGPFLNEMPGEIANFYKTVHSGWYENISGGLGLLPLQDIEWLSDKEWGILKNIHAPDFNLDRVFYIFHNASTGYLCINVNDPDSPEYLIFWSDKAPKLDIGFWSFLDSWIEIGLTN